MNAFELVPASEADARAATGWVRTATDTLLFAGPGLGHPWTAADLLNPSRDGWQVYSLHDEEARPVSVGSIRPEEGRAHLGRLLVDPERRGQGIGRALVKQLLAQARLMGHDTATLGVYAHNRNALGLYQSLGFREESRVDGPDGWASLRMAAPIRRS